MPPPCRRLKLVEFAVRKNPQLLGRDDTRMMEDDCIDACRLSVDDWAAFAPGIACSKDWLDWARTPFPPTGNARPALELIPAMLRRRLNNLGRMALQVASDCHPENGDPIPMVFASRHGDIHRTAALLEQIARGEPLSPTQFGLSTHNAIVAQYSIARQLTQNYSAIAAGRSTAEAAVLEAAGLLADGATAVLLVMYDQPLPDCYASFQDEPQANYAWAWRLVPEQPDRPVLSLSRIDEPPENPRTPTLPGGLELLRFFLSGDSIYARPDTNGHWQWERHA